MSHTRALAIVAISILASWSSSACEGARQSGKTAVIEDVRLDESLVVAVAPKITPEDEEKLTDLAIAFDDFERYLPGIRRWCEATGIPMKIVVGTAVRVRSRRGPARLLEPGRNVPEFGILMFSGSSPVRTLEGVQTDDGFEQAACEYFRRQRRVASYCAATKR